LLEAIKKFKMLNLFLSQNTYKSKGVRIQCQQLPTNADKDQERSIDHSHTKTIILMIYFLCSTPAYLCPFLSPTTVPYRIISLSLSQSNKIGTVPYKLKLSKLCFAIKDALQTFFFYCQVFLNKPFAI
jgi:hypothetical protein